MRLSLSWNLLISRTATIPTNVRQNMQTKGISPTTAPAQIPSLGSHRAIGKVCMSAIRTDAALDRFYPNCIRKRLAPDLHALVTGDVDRDVIQEHECPHPTKLALLIRAAS